ncbi:PREDICTED: putative F-box/LRR-repeat protein At3g44080 [Camelina sativa]|uniref:F-box/LRR-repeat protein At3g44080 n=1 Tax=Camelina sativa TaxID=90675 RepID=A0ABM1RKV4_CAMSA|nr:PREDICTED: putative F-box/LRR-repeat protein At3g44080 [Camelina sativa]
MRSVSMDCVASMDSLPDDLLVQILSFLPTKQTVSTSILSKRWRTLFAFSPNLDFDESVFRLPKEMYIRSVDSVLAFQGGKHMEKFSLVFKSFDDEVYDVDRWICYALEHGVSELHLDIESIRYYVDRSNLCVVGLCYHPWRESPYCHVDSLAKAKLDLQFIDFHYEADDADLTTLISGIRNVKTLHLTSSAVEVILVCCKGELPVFKNLIKLIFSSKKKGWKMFLPLLLERSPKLNTLVLSDLHRYTFRGRTKLCVGVQIPSNNKIKMLSILQYEGSANELKHINHFLLKMECFEMVKVYVAAEMDDLKKMQLTDDLLKLSTASSKVKIQLM